MQYTLRNIPPNVDQALRERARREGRSLNEVAVEALKRALGLSDAPMRHRDLRDIAGTWVDDPQVDATLEEQRQIEPAMWK